MTQPIMVPSDPNQPTVIDATLDEVKTVEFTKRELILIHNIIVRQEYSLGDAMLFLPLVEKIRPLVQTETPAESPVKVSA